MNEADRKADLGRTAGRGRSERGRPEPIFNTYSSAQGEGASFILCANGALLQRIDLPERGAMPVPRWRT